MSDFEFDTKPRKGKPVAEPVAIEAKEDVKVETAETPEKKEYDKDELARIFDEILFTGEYSEEVLIKGRLKVRLKTRNAEELSQISRVLDGTSFTLMQTLHENRLLLNLQYSLLQYHSTDLSSLKIEERAKFINRLAGPIIATLIDAMIEFDKKVGAACQESEENF